MIALTVQFLCVAVAIATAEKSCEIRFEDTGACACSSSYDTVGPNCFRNSSIDIPVCYCMYYDSTQNLTIVGHCYYTCFEFFGGSIMEVTSSAEFNADICNTFGHLNRTGRFCGQCSNTHGLAAYSYQLLDCIPCQDYGYKNWLRYFAVAILPLTVFYTLAVLLSFNITSSSLNGVVLVIQCIMSPLFLTIAHDNLSALYSLNRLSSLSITLKVITSIFGVMNLDFFRYVYPPFCLHPKANIFQILSLDYLVALYPFLLIFLTYVLVTAHDKQYRLVVWMWRPVQRCVHRHRNTWNIHTSLIEIFATFILFSSVKILDASVQILAFTATYDVAGNRLQQYFTYYDGTKVYFGSAHLPYALLAITFSFIFVALPFFLLVLYPCRCFHKCLDCCGLRSQALHVFMDAFQGSYRTEPHDLRYFSAFYLLLRLLMLLQMHIIESYLMLFTSGMLLFLSAAVVAIVQPYKVKHHNSIDSVLMILMGIFYISYYSSTNVYAEEVFFFQGLSVALLLLYFIFLFVWKLVGEKLQAVVGKARVMWRSIARRSRGQSEGEGVEAFDREVDTSDASSYPSLGGPQKPTY